MRTVQQAPAVVTVPVELDRAPSSSPATALVAAIDLGCLAITAGTGCAPPSGFAANAPPALYLESFLRL
jgi:hypothetical protein